MSANGRIPSLVLVHGAWHGPWVWERLIAEMPGVTVRTVTLTSTGPDPTMLGDLYADARAVRAVVDKIDGPVVVCGHSYGGIPMTEALRDAEHVVGLVYISAWVPDAGETPMGVPGGGPVPDWQEFHPDEGYTVALRPREVFYGDVDDGAAAEAVARLHRYQALAPFGQVLTHAAWRATRSLYVICEQDRAVPTSVQEVMALRCAATARLPSSHSPFLSCPAEVAALLRAELARTGGPAARTPQ